MDALSRWKQHRRRGNYSIFMALFLFVVIGFSALAVDISYITTAELQAQAAADAASHAALVAYRQNDSVAEGNNAAQWILDENQVAAVTADIVPGFPKYGSYDHNNGTFCTGCSPHINAVEIAVTREGTNSVDLLLAPLLGITEAEVDGHAITAQQKRAMMLIMDMSCSMMDSYCGGTVGCGAVHVGREANLRFLNYLVNHPQDDDMLGMSVFGQDTTAAAWSPLMKIDGNAGTIADNFEGVCSTYPNWPLICNSTAANPPTNEPMPQGIGGCTSPGPAMEQAISEIVTKTDRVFFKGMLVFSDGLPNCNGGGGRAINAANTAWANDIHIWSIVYHNGSFNPTFMSSLVRGIGFSQVSPNPADLPDMYEEVAKSLPTALVD